MMKRTAAAVCGAAVLAAGMTGCGAGFEGSGSKDAASAEQLAMRLDDPWAQEVQAAQGAGIDAISGATITTAGVRQAVEDALSQAEAAAAKQEQGGFR